MTQSVQNQSIDLAIHRASRALIEQSKYLTELDQAVGDGDTGITLVKVADALVEYVAANPIDDVGKYLAAAGMATNRAAPSTLGTLTATALMAAGKTVKGQSEITTADLARMFEAAVEGVQRRGKASLGDKTVVDSLHPACVAFSEAIDGGAPLADAGVRALRAAERGRDHVTPLQSKIGRASWLGERTEGRVDPGCEAFVIVMKAIVGNHGDPGENYTP